MPDSLGLRWIGQVKLNTDVISVEESEMGLSRRARADRP